MSIAYSLGITPDQARRVTGSEVEALNRIIRRASGK